MPILSSELRFARPADHVIFTIDFVLLAIFLHVYTHSLQMRNSGSADGK